MKAFLIKLANGNLAPRDEGTREYLERRKTGEVLSCEIKRSRNYENHKRFMSFIRATFDMQDNFDEIEVYRKWLVMKCGYFKTVVSPKGYTMFWPESISFENMDEEEFQKLFSTAIDVFLRELGRGLTEEDVLRVIEYD